MVTLLILKLNTLCRLRALVSSMLSKPPKQFLACSFANGCFCPMVKNHIVH